MKFLQVFNKNVEIIALIAFIILTLIISLLRIPFYDETHAFIISRLSLNEIFYLTRIEGHPILWYLILKPFSNLNFYPYSMAVINWTFASLMIILFWKKAPFNSYIKLLLTFSFPFFQYLGVVSRPYTLGVLIIFLLATFYNDSLKRPILYAFLLVLCANISFITFILACAFGILFIYRIFKEKNLSKRQHIAIWSLFLFGFFFLCSQFVFLEKPEIQAQSATLDFLNHLSYFIFRPFADLSDKNFIQILLHFFGMLSFYYFIYIFFKKAKSSLFFMLFVIISSVLFFVAINTGNFWHYYFIFIALICALWINWDELKKYKLVNIFFILLILLNMTSFSVSKDGENPTNQTELYKKTLNTFVNDEKYKNAKLFYFQTYSHFSPGLLMYFKKNNMTVFNSKGVDKTSFENIRNMQNYDNLIFEPENFVKYIDDNSYLIANVDSTSIFKNFSYVQDNVKIYFDFIEYYPELYLLVYKLRYEKL